MTAMNLTAWRPISLPAAVILSLFLLIFLLALFSVATQVSASLQVRHRKDEHIFVRHGMKGLTAVTALRLCQPLETWHCPGSFEYPSTLVVLCRERATDRAAVGVISTLQQADGRHVLLTAYIVDSYRTQVARLVARNCTPIAGIEIRWP